MNLEYEFSLRRVACVSIGASIWKRKLSENEAKELLLQSAGDPHRYNTINNKWCDHVNEVIKKFSQDLTDMCVPQDLHYELFWIMGNMGLRICGWFLHLQDNVFPEISNNCLFENYIKNQIYWTPFGMIDEMKIFKLCWLNNCNINICHKYSLACLYCSENEIKHFWEIMESNSQLESYVLNNGNIKSTSTSPLFMTYFLAYWNNRRNPSNELIYQIFNLKSNDVIGSHLLEEKMLIICASHGEDIAFKYFWSQLDDQKKKERLAELWVEEILNDSMINFSLTEIVPDLIDKYSEDKNFEICRFLIRNMMCK